MVYVGTTDAQVAEPVQAALMGVFPAYFRERGLSGLIECAQSTGPQFAPL
jgi:hypothetical protein